uniref:Rhomboid protein Illhe_RBL9 n=1 Tax=Illicium henryi TaxID=114516 RepID=A0A0A7E6M6_9MAGN|nr:rhomboid protein Illhe_RBL9 [Illicium henryi]
MAVSLACSIGFYKGQVCPLIQLRQHERNITDNSISTQNASRYTCIFSSITGDIDKIWLGLHHHASYLSMKENRRRGDASFCMGGYMKAMPLPITPRMSILHTIYCMDNHIKSTPNIALQMEKHSAESSTSETTSASKKQLKLLESYFIKLHNEVKKQQTLETCTGDPETVISLDEYNQTGAFLHQPDKVAKSLKLNESEYLRTGKGLTSLDNYFDKLNELELQKVEISDEETMQSYSVRIQSNLESESHEKKEDSKYKLESSTTLNENASPPFGSENFQDQPYDEASNFYLISILAAINIAVFLFEIASPIRNDDSEYLSLPLMYGAKINGLILDGEWWRLVTPMFLHSGFLHVALGCWALLTFGPQVCRGYGSFTFFLIYILGGICGNLTSFIHTPEPTVGGTGPVFAIIGAWLIYQFQNKEMIAKNLSEDMFRKAVIATCLSCVLSNFGRIDDWTHLGAISAGLVYGFVTCPVVQLDNAKKHSRRGDCTC